MKKSIYFAFLLPILIISCSDDETSQKMNIKYENAIVHNITTYRLKDGSLVVNNTTSYYKNGSVFKTRTTLDTLPNIGYENVTIKDNEDNDKDTTVFKAYDIFFKSVNKRDR